MSKKKTSKTKKITTKAKKEIDINDIDAMFEDMKNLAIETPKEEETEVVSEKVEETSASIPKEEVAEIMLPEADNKLAYADTPMDEEETNVEPEMVEEAQTEGEKIVEEEPKEVPTEAEKTEEDLSFVEEIKEEEPEKKEVKEEQKAKPKRKMTYQEMFGGTWRGYGYDSY